MVDKETQLVDINILIVEDDPFMRRLYERVFRLSGYGIMLAANGEEAITTLETADTKPVLILLDIMMPKLSGFDVLRYIKSKKHLKNIPVIVLTNLAEKENAEKALELGAVLFLVKSQHDPKEVVDKVREIIAAYSHLWDILPLSGNASEAEQQEEAKDKKNEKEAR